MKVILLGNAGSGKTTLSHFLMTQTSAARLSLDEVAFLGGAERRPIADSVADVRAFIDRHPDWILEGCYADILEPVVSEAEVLIFLNPGIEACIAHCRARPWERTKFATPEEQDRNLENLIAWVRTYDTRDDEYGLRRHRALFVAYPGNKVELSNPATYLEDVARL